MNIDELCSAVNRRLRTEKIKVENGRTALRVTPRNVRFYRTIGILSSPGRAEGRAAYTESHVEEIVTIKRLQAEGHSLDEVRALMSASSDTDESVPDRQAHLAAVLFARTSVETNERRWSSSPLSSLMHVDAAFDMQREFGWSVRVGDVTLSGTGRPPTQERIDSIARILSGATTDEPNAPA